MSTGRRDSPPPAFLLQLRLPLDETAAAPQASQPTGPPPPPGHERRRSVLSPGRTRRPGQPISGDVAFVRNRRARRYILRVATDGAARVTIPRGGSLREAHAFLRDQAGWLDRQRARMRVVSAERDGGWQVGGRILVGGESVQVRAADAAGHVVALGSHVVELDPRHPPRRSLVAHLRALASRELPPRVGELATRLSLSPARVLIRDQRSRWGSCSPSGTISLNWRLVQMPARVADYVIVHELMHLEQPNHSRRFWRLVREACPWTDEARAWLRRHGAALL